jgi:type II secretory pathway component PulF
MAPPAPAVAATRRPGVAAIVCVAILAIELLAIALLAFVWVPAMKAMFDDFGRSTPLPLLTRVVMGWWWPTAWIAVLLALTAVAMLGVRAERRRVVVLAVAMVLGAAQPMLTWWGMYLPIFELAGKIRVE